MQIGILGLGKMGSRLMEKLLKGGHEIVAWNRSKDVLDKLKLSAGDYMVGGKMDVSYSLDGLREKLLEPRIFWVMLPAGEATEAIISDITNIAEPGDIVVDGGNSNYKDSQRHGDELKKKGLKYLGIGISGGVNALENGFCMMIGGDRGAYDYIVPALDTLAQPNGGYNYFGEGGAGHFVKMVHNGIEYGMMQAIGEGFGILEKSPYPLNLIDIGYIWQRGSIVRSFLLDMAVNAFVTDPDFYKIDGIIDATGEGKWTVEQAAAEHVPAVVIEKSLDFRKRSQYDRAVQSTFAAKLVAAMRNQFGGHAVKTKEGE